MSSGDTMSKKLIIPSNMKMIKRFKDKVDGYILGVDGLSVNMPWYFKLDEVIDLIKKNDDKEFFVSLNKNMHDSDLEDLKVALTKLDKTNVKGIIYYDISIVNLKEELDLNLELVWNQEHMTNNYFTINYWKSHGVDYTWLSNDITLNEIKEIEKNVDSKLMIELFGYVPMFTSYRHLVNNYLKTFNLKERKDYYIEKEGKSYSIVDDDRGTTVYSSNILNGLYESVELDNLDYIILNSYNIDEDCFEIVVELFDNVNDKNKVEYKKIIDNMFKNTDSGFLYKETVYKVK